jgi:hypothetical protein
MELIAAQYRGRARVLQEKLFVLSKSEVTLKSAVRMVCSIFTI